MFDNSVLTEAIGYIDDAYLTEYFETERKIANKYANRKRVINKLIPYVAACFVLALVIFVVPNVIGDPSSTTDIVDLSDCGSDCPTTVVAPFDLKMPDGVIAYFKYDIDGKRYVNYSLDGGISWQKTGILEIPYGYDLLFFIGFEGGIRIALLQRSGEKMQLAIYDSTNGIWTMRDITEGVKFDEYRYSNVVSFSFNDADNGYYSVMDDNGEIMYYVTDDRGESWGFAGCGDKNCAKHPYYEPKY